MQLKNEILSQLDSLLDDARRLDESFTMSDRGTTESAIGEHEHRAFATAARAAIRRLSGLDSEYYKSLPDIDQTRISVAGYGGNNISIIRGTLQSLRKAVEDGLLVSIEQKLRANFHDDFLEQAKRFLQSLHTCNLSRIQ